MATTVKAKVQSYKNSRETQISTVRPPSPSSFSTNYFPVVVAGDRFETLLPFITIAAKSSFAAFLV